jgi:hypothetical protein
VCVRFASADEAAVCVAAVADDGMRVGGRTVEAFIHDGRDLSSRLFRKQELRVEEEEVERAVDWEEFLYDAESDDEDIQVRTE